MLKVQGGPAWGRLRQTHLVQHLINGSGFDLREKFLKNLVAVGAGHDDLSRSQLRQFSGHVADDPEHDVSLPHEIAGGAAAVEHDARIRQLPAQVGVSRLHHPGGVARQGAAREKDPGRLAGGGVRAAQGKGRGSAPLDEVLDAFMRGQRPLDRRPPGLPGPTGRAGRRGGPRGRPPDRGRSNGRSRESGGQPGPVPPGDGPALFPCRETPAHSAGERCSA